ncbi:acetyl esterase/lipase [Pedobacter africanus]|uniref:Acetyl esterase/lipase n=1 Tax=Pedobacter africanus TaxID=151894 RepID=A0ACC6L1C2_9SPHI|nr:alpha/beta hydrolase [Pedobacter africanus]MDR6785220.1 acetyl esterase/lipase [Pedobacter africanus]
MNKERNKTMMKSLTMIVMLLLTHGAFAQQVLPLYPDAVPNSKVRLNEREQPTLTVYLPAADRSSGTAIIIFPGGGYGTLVTDTEGTPIARAFLEQGIAAIVVKYRLPDAQKMQDKSLGPLMDAQQAMKTVRAQAADWHINPSKIGVIGFSAGGHLASTLGTHYKTSYIPNKENISLRPDFMVLVYPVISMDTALTHMGSRINLLGKEPSPERVGLFSNENQVTRDTPPAYLTHTGDDQVVKVDNSIVFYRALQQHKVDSELHLFAKGDHGFVLKLPPGEWMQPIYRFMERQGF